MITLLQLRQQHGMLLKISPFHPHLQVTEYSRVESSLVMNQAHRRQQSGMLLKIPQFHPHLQVTEHHRVLPSSVVYQALQWKDII
ncbi:hypothetical protein PR048_016471 [Dryococelus australis]|uniref:Uncharacterized protein n=1 Tax=Dryococelus australis TaxID=614101 RepID=A0ABQ9HJU6_9NEOP|nr:hypothetical protein PR048_016471 [Dryococelus australis]